MTGSYYSLNQYVQDAYGEKLYRLSLNGGMSCPNRDGTIGTGGCIFCSEGGSGDFASDGTLPISQQIDSAKERIQKKFKGSHYIGYFQSFTNTYGSLAYLENLFSEALRHPEIRLISIATRPDCVNDDIIALLCRLKAQEWPLQSDGNITYTRKDIWLELGLQTIHEHTATLIHRGYPLSVFEDTYDRLCKAAIPCIVHVILGLPGESKADMLATIDYLAEKQISGIKLQLLHILKNTRLGDLYESNPFPVFEMEDYITFLSECLEHLPATTVIHRLTGDGPKNLLIAPLWSGDKKRVLNTLNNYLKEHDIRQGKQYSNNCRRQR